MGPASKLCNAAGVQSGTPAGIGLAIIA